MTETPNSRLGRLELNSQLYKYDAHMEKCADLIDDDLDAWLALPLVVQDRSSFYKDTRDSYRRFVAAGGPDDRGPTQTPEGNQQHG